jgi:hypothetical protein
MDKPRVERHVRTRHHLPPTLPNLRLHPEEKQLLGVTGRFRVLALKDVAQTSQVPAREGPSFRRHF